MNIRNFDHLITTCPHDIQQLFISDLHLDEHSLLLPSFLSFLDDLLALSHLNSLYVLGDWFEVWIGDDSYLSLSVTDKKNHWITPIVDKLNQLHINGCQTFVLTGNRDFLLRQGFCDTFAGMLVSEPYCIEVDNKIFRLEHGDLLCTDDVDYQKLRTLTHNRLIQWILLHCTLSQRQKIASKLRNTSKQAHTHKSLTIMDVNQNTVKQAMSECEVLVHGHTHRPDIHQLADNKIRYVLGDWRIEQPTTSYEQVTAVIGVVYRLQDTDELVYEMVDFTWQS